MACDGSRRMDSGNGTGLSVHDCSPWRWDLTGCRMCPLHSQRKKPSDDAGLTCSGFFPWTLAVQEADGQGPITKSSGGTSMAKNTEDRMDDWASPLINYLLTVVEEAQEQLPK